MRFISCIQGFKEEYNKWPTKVRVDPAFIEELQEEMTPEDHKKLIEKIPLIPDGSRGWDDLYIAEDDRGNSYDLMLKGHSYAEIDVLEWIGIDWPDYGED